MKGVRFPMKRTNILCAMRDLRTAESLQREMENAERCSFRIVNNGDLALISAEQEQPDILVIDAVLPQIDGLGVVDSMRRMLGTRMPRVIGGSMMPFTDEGFRRRGVDRIVRVPWDLVELRAAIEELIERINTQIEWERAQEDFDRASALLRQMGMRGSLHGFTFLAWAAALACEREDRLYTLGERIYVPIADRFSTTPQNVERLIRHAVESTMDAVGARGVYGFFGNTIDPTRGKPTNGQMIGMLAQRMRVS